ncbi:MmgE/PrpD family protein [Siccirubricoccus sp. KC 17139]|uniref:MmgE/PrpD family protein n=1 Tax=Siccirubricoccus soli TaxID=2899147 RepID=A0ABT1D557_9PROT|nr:MmgE/PrpD family protein [Siccirubricoccus soli]MCO6416762.1 MmgE/PrpD family protein [Siccirubricoccus soli]MCP2682897.1 MmgE/PrpD family protein [Siccirubricoccus soli]
MAQPYAGELLGRFIAGSDWAAIPPALRQEGVRSILNHIGCALGVARDPAVLTPLGVMRGLSAAPTATVYGQGLKLDAMGAVFVNAIAGNLLDYDDTHLNTVIHPAAPVAPVCLALAEQRGLSGAQVLHAFLLGGEVECRIGNAVSPGHYARGWHITSTCGAFGAAAAAAKLLGLSATQCWHALGIASSQSAGTVENLPSAAKNVSVGNAARLGLFAALLAEAGYEAAPAAIEGPLGWARAMGDEPDVAAITEGLGTRWEIARTTYKPYPAGIVFHAVIDACLALRAARPVPPEAIAAVEVAGDALLLARGDRAVRNNRDARVSIHHSAALGLVLGRAGVAEFEQAAVDDPVLAAFRAKVTAKLDAGLPRGAARVTVRYADGSAAERVVTDPVGSEANPLSEAALDAKYRDNAALGGFAERAEAQIAAIRGLETAADIRPLMALLA